MRHDANLPRLQNPNVPGEGRRSAPAVAEVQQYIDALRRRWWIIAAAAIIAVGFAWWGERNRIPIYTAEVLIEQRRESPITGVVGGPGAEFASQLEVIRSRAVVAAVVDSLGLQVALRDRLSERSRIIERVEVAPDVRGGVYSLERNGGQLVLRTAGTMETVATAGVGDWIGGEGFRILLRDPSLLDREPLLFQVRDAQVAVEQLRGRIRVEPGRAAALVRISYGDPDPELAAAVVGSMASAYQRHRGEAAREAAIRRREVIASQLVGLADSLQNAQAAVVNYQRNARLLDPSFEGGRVMASVLEVENELRTLRFEEGLLASLVAGLESEEGRDESLNRILSLGNDLVPAGPTLHSRLQSLDIERARLTASSFGRLGGDPAVQVVDSLIASTKAQMRSAVEQGLEHHRTRIAGAEERLATMRADMGAIPGQTAELAQFRQRADAVQGVVNGLVNRYYEAQIAVAVERGDIAVIDPPVVPLRPDASRTRLVLLMGLVGGLMVGGLGAMVMEFLDFRVRRSEDAEDATGLPLIGMVPRMGVPATRDPVAAAIGREAFRALRTNLQFARGGTPTILAVSSATPKEGKTTVSVNLAASLAEQQGSKPVLLIDADLRRPQIHRAFGMDRGFGLTDVLRGDSALDDAVRVSPLHPNLMVLTCGGPVTNPSELVGSGSFVNLIDELRHQFAFVVIDTPPLLAVTDGTVIAKMADGTLIVVRANQVDRVAVTKAMEQLRHINAALLGVILNGVASRSEEGRYAYGYHEEYLEEVPVDAHENGRKEEKRPLLGAGT